MPFAHLAVSSDRSFPAPMCNRPALRRGLAENAVARHGVSIALACRTFGVSETCYRYSPLLSDENEEIADLLVGLTTARRTWGFGLCFLHLRNVQGHPAHPTRKAAAERLH